MGTYHVHIGPREAQGAQSGGIQLRHDILIHQSAIHHRHHAEHLRVGDASSLHHLGLHAHLCGDVGGGASAAVNEHFESWELCKLADEPAEGGRIFHNHAPHLDDVEFLFHAVG